MSEITRTRKLFMDRGFIQANQLSIPARAWATVDVNIEGVKYRRFFETEQEFFYFLIGFMSIDQELLSEIFKSNAGNSFGLFTDGYLRWFFEEETDVGTVQGNLFYYMFELADNAKLVKQFGRNTVLGVREWYKQNPA